MVKRMLVDTNHPEETRVVVLDGTRLDAFDVETSTKKQNKGNIYLAKVIRVEPSLQAAFVDYGGNRHGFLAFSEIHPDYYQIPVADREALLAEAKEHEKSFQDDDDQDAPEASPDSTSNSAPVETENEKTDAVAAESAANAAPDAPQETDTSPAAVPLEQAPEARLVADDTPPNEAPSDGDAEQSAPADATQADAAQNGDAASSTDDKSAETSETTAPDAEEKGPEENVKEENGTRAKGKPGVEELGGEDETEERLDVHRRKFVASRRYKIQEVIKRRQILLIQVVKEERGNKGAALTTYLSLAGRYCVLMPNSARGGGVSRKITNLKDRRRLKSIVSELKISEHMAVILRTAGSERTKPEIKRDYEYLQRTWNQIREVTMESRAPALIHEEANLIKRSIRDVYTRDIEEILVEGEEGYRAAKEFMKTLTPSHAKKVQRYKDESIPLFHRYQVESQLDAMHSPTVTLKSGGSIVFGQTEALVAIDVNSGRATKERHIEETAVKTNLEAASEIARQLRLRDLAGLVVIDFIDMDENRNNHAVERRLKEALKSDRARIQVGRISHFGLLELSRQRLRPSLMETNFETCKSCGGTGMIRSTESTSIQTLRAIEEEGLRNRTAELTVSVHPDVALYVLNYKREILEEIQKRHGMTVFILGDSSLIPPDMSMDRVKGDGPRRSDDQSSRAAVIIEDEPEDDTSDDTSRTARDSGRDGRRDGANDDEQEGGRKKRRRRRRKKRVDGDETNNQNSDPAQAQAITDGKPSNASDEQEDEDGEPRKGRRRGRRGGRRRKRKSEDSNAEAGSQSENENSNADAKNADTSSVDPIPVQATPEQPAKAASRFLSVFKKGADALLGGSSENDTKAVIAPEPKTAEKAVEKPKPEPAQAPTQETKPEPKRAPKPKPKPKTARKAEPEAAPKAELKPTPAAPPKPAPKPVVAEKPAAVDPAPTPAPSAPTAPPPIEKAEGPPRKGWWSNDS